MSNPPPNACTLSIAWRKELVVIAPTTMVKTTNVNIASVTPVRKTLRSG
jgi:hypothetical protein